MASSAIAAAWPPQLLSARRPCGSRPALAGSFWPAAPTHAPGSATGDGHAFDWSAVTAAMTVWQRCPSTRGVCQSSRPPPPRLPTGSSALPCFVLAGQPPQAGAASVLTGAAVAVGAPLHSDQGLYVPGLRPRLPRCAAPNRAGCWLGSGPAPNLLPPRCCAYAQANALPWLRWSRPLNQMLPTYVQLAIWSPTRPAGSGTTSMAASSLVLGCALHG